MLRRLPHKSGADAPQLGLFVSKSPPPPASTESTALGILAASSLPGVGFRTTRKLYDRGALSLLVNGDHETFRAALTEVAPTKLAESDSIPGLRLEPALESARAQLEDLRLLGTVVVSDRDTAYPERLRALKDPPRWLFVEGNIEAVRSSSMVSIVGTRQASREGLRLAHESARFLAAKGFVVLSGLARGIDEQAHRGATRVYGKTVAVLGQGTALNQANDQISLRNEILGLGGAVVSEYMPTDPPSRQTFLRRNELVAAMARVVVPIECPDLNSGTGATIRRALRVGTPVVGIRSKKVRSTALDATAANLEELGLDSFTVHNGDTDRLWAYLSEIVPEHTWDRGRSRQQHFLEETASWVAAADAVALLGLGSEDIERLSDLIVQRLRSS